MCDGGVVENSKGIEKICSNCCGKGLIYVTEKRDHRSTCTKSESKEE